MFDCLFIFKRVVIHCWWYDLHHSIHRWNTTIIPIKKYKRSLHGGNPVRVYCSSCFISLYIKKVRSCWNNKFRKKNLKIKKTHRRGQSIGGLFWPAVLLHNCWEQLQRSLSTYTAKRFNSFLLFNLDSL